PSCLNGFGLNVPVSGTGAFKTDLVSEGNGYPELAHNLSGTFNAKIGAGTVPIDFARLLAAQPPLEASGWTSDGPTAFDQLSADCRVNAGVLWCQSLRIETPKGTIAGAGEVDLPKQMLDWNLAMTKADDTAKPAQTGGTVEPKVSIRGPMT